MATTLKPVIGTPVDFTVTALNSLASDTNLLAGWSSEVVNNESVLAIDEIVSGKFFAGTSPTVSKIIELWAWSVTKPGGSPVYPDAITGSAGAISITSRNVLFSGAFARLGTVTIDSTSNREYPFSFSVAQAFGFMPARWGCWAVHNNGVALKSSGNLVTHTPIQFTNV